MAKRLSEEEKRAIAAQLGEPDRPLQQIVNWKDNPESPPAAVVKAVKAMRSPAMTTARAIAAKRFQQTEGRK